MEKMLADTLIAPRGGKWLHYLANELANDRMSLADNFFVGHRD